MGRYKIEFSKEANNDLINIVKYIKNNLHEDILARKLFQIIKEKIYILLDTPKMFCIIDNNYIHKLELRKIVVNNYIIFYITGKCIF